MSVVDVTLFEFRWSDFIFELSAILFLLVALLTVFKVIKTKVA
ncbi:hypothetical protein [Alkalicoccobacillus plakortidis]|nr:hypothetical protein [Alkalicoccobacillus plakortidis]